MDPWCRGREVARGVVRTLLKGAKMLTFLPSARDRDFWPEIFGRLFSVHERPNVFLRHLSGVRYISPAVV